MLLKYINKLKTKSFLTTSLLLTSSICSAADYEVQGGTFFMNFVTPSPIAITAGNNTGVLTENTYQGTPGSGAVTNQALLAPFPFQGVNVYTYTAQTGIDAVIHAAPTINISGGTANLGSFYAFWNGIEFNQGNTNVAVNDNFDCTYSLSWSSLINGGPFNSFTGVWTMDVLDQTCSIAPGILPSLIVTQDTVVTDGRISKIDGGFTIATDIANTAGYIFDWSATNDSIDLGGTITTDTLTFANANTLTAGTYNISVKITDTTTSPVQVSVATRTLTVVDTGQSSDFEDADNDGIVDTQDGIDNLTSPTLLQTQNTNSTTHVMRSDLGKLVMGRIARCIGNSSAGITFANIASSAGTDCTPVTNAYETTNAVNTGIGGIFDFEVRNLTAGAQVQVVIPLSTTLPKNPAYRKYAPAKGWVAFNTSTDSLSSTAGTDGICPESTSTEWTAGLTEGHNCIRVSITDGGINDADGIANGVVVDPSTINGYDGIDTSNVTVGGGWWFLMGLPALIGMRRLNK